MSETGTAKVRPGQCPICGRQSDERYRPFCSKRCADVDLNRWLTGSYAFPGAPDETDEDGERPPEREDGERE